MKKYQRVDASNSERLVNLVRTAPKQIMLACSEREVQKGIPAHDIMNVPYTITFLGGCGSAIKGTCADTGKEMYMMVDAHTGVANTKYVDDKGNAFTGWKPVKRAGKSLLLLIPVS